MDPRHRPGRGLGIIWDFYKANECYEYAIDLEGNFCIPPMPGTIHVSPNVYFFDWIERIAAAGDVWTAVLFYCAYAHYAGQNLFENNNVQLTGDILQEYISTVTNWPGLGQPGVKFLESIERLRYRVWRTTDGRLGWKYDPFRRDGELLDTRGGHTAFGTQGFIWTLNMDGQFYTTPQQLGRLHHSTLTAGTPVQAAGEWIVDQGNLVLLSGQTGHYKTPMKALYTAVCEIDRKLGIPPDKYNVKLFRKLPSGQLQEIHVPAIIFRRDYWNNTRGMENSYQVFGR